MNSSVSKITWKSIGIVAIAMILLMALKATVIALLLPLIFVSFELLLGNRLNTRDKETNFVILLILLGTVLLLICEVLFVRDFFGNRMNTVFKVYYQVWQMLAIASAYAAYFFLSRDWHQKVSVAVRIGTSASLTVAVLLAIGSFVYPVTATITKISEGLGNPTLDGQAFMGTSQRGDYEAIAWLNREVAGTPVILEATGGSYTSSARISAFTGLPTVIGWDGHELQWRGSGEEASRRKSEVDAIYLTTDDQLARSLLKKYNVSYVYVGNLEREAYGKAGSLDKFAKLGSVVYQRAGVTIYKLGLD